MENFVNIVNFLQKEKQTIAFSVIIASVILTTTAELWEGVLEEQTLCYSTCLWLSQILCISVL